MRSTLKILVMFFNCWVAFLIGMQFTTLTVVTIPIALVFAWATLWCWSVIDGNPVRVMK